MKSYHEIKSLITVDCYVRDANLRLIYDRAKELQALDGEVSEVGVYRGASAKFIANCYPDKLVHIFDTFAGMPPHDPLKDNHHREGDFKGTSLEEVQSFLSDCDNVRIYQGFFPDTVKPIENKKFCFVHVDVDIYMSTKACYEFFYPRLVIGGVIMCDDYAAGTCAGATEAIQEFFSDKQEQPDLIVEKGP